MNDPAFPKVGEAIRLLRDQGLNLDPMALIPNFSTYHSLCSTWNLSAKLMSPTDLRDRFDDHLADCLSLLPYVAGHRAKHPSAALMDIGAGAGLPGVVLALALPDMPVTEVERSETKCLFLRQAIARLSLASATVSQINFPNGEPPSAPTIYTARATETPEIVDLEIARRLKPQDCFLSQRPVPHLSAIETICIQEIKDAFSTAGLRRGALNVVTT